MRIPIFGEGGSRHLGFVRDVATLNRYMFAKNILVTRRRQGDVIRIDVVAVLEDPELDSRGKPLHGIGPNSVHSTYEEEMSRTAPLTVMKRVGPDRQFERWAAKEGFPPKRFNPDHIPPALACPWPPLCRA